MYSNKVVSIIFRYVRNATELLIYCFPSEWQNWDPARNLEGVVEKHASLAYISSYTSQYFTVFQNMF